MQKKNILYKGLSLHFIPLTLRIKTLYKVLSTEWLKLGDNMDFSWQVKELRDLENHQAMNFNITLDC